VEVKKNEVQIRGKGKVPHFILHSLMKSIEMRMKKSGEKEHCRGKRKY
jgi:hypothetical protein